VVHREPGIGLAVLEQDGHLDEIRQLVQRVKGAFDRRG
jgi:hypothetical protein